MPCGDGRPRTTDQPYSSISLALHYDPPLKLAILLGNSQWTDVVAFVVLVLVLLLRPEGILGTSLGRSKA